MKGPSVTWNSVWLQGECRGWVGDQKDAEESSWDRSLSVASNSEASISVGLSAWKGEIGPYLPSPSPPQRWPHMCMWDTDEIFGGKSRSQLLQKRNYNEGRRKDGLFE